MRPFRQFILKFLLDRGYTVIKTERLASERHAALDVAEGFRRQEHELAELRAVAHDLGALRADFDSFRHNLAQTIGSLARNWNTDAEATRKALAQVENQVARTAETVAAQGEDLRRLVQEYGAQRVSRLLFLLRERTAGQKKFFNLVTFGRTATHWIAAALNLHPEVVCVHGPDLDPYRDGETEEERTARHHNDAKLLATMPVDDYYDVLERKNASVYGVIHGLIALDAMQHQEPYRRYYFVGCITREPVSRLQSFVNRWLYEYNAIPGAGGEILAAAEQRALKCRALGIAFPDAAALSLEEKIFVSAAYWMLTTEPINVDGIRKFRIEDICADRNAFADFFRALVQGALEPSDDYLDTVMALPRQEVRSSGTDAPAIFAAWAPWQRALFGALIEHTKLRDGYTALGYDLSFVFPPPEPEIASSAAATAPQAPPSATGKI